MPSKRLSDHWIKLKPEYLDNVMTDMDLLVVGRRKITHCC